MAIIPIDAAMIYAAAGIPVLPIWWSVDGQCACGRRCSSPAKHPIADAAPKGSRDATTDATRIAAWWRRWSNANVAIATGGPIWLLDIDRGGLAPWGAMVEEYGAVASLTATTGSGGRHILFRASAGAEVRNSAGKVAPGIDVRGEGGYALVEPSQNLAGAYGWVDHDLDADDLMGAIHEAPGWLLARVLGSDAPKGPCRQDALAKLLTGAEAGARNVSAARMAGHLIARGLELDVAMMAMVGWNARNRPPLPDDELRKVVESVWRADLRQHPERQQERAEVAETEARIAADADRREAIAARVAERRADVAARDGAREVELGRIGDGLGLDQARPAGAALADPAERRRHLSLLTGWLGVRVDRWIRQGTTDAQFVLITEAGDRLVIGDVTAVLAPALFERSLYLSAGVTIGKKARERAVWDRVLAALHAILEVEEGGDSLDQLRENIWRYVEESRALTPEASAPERRARAIRHGDPWVDDAAGYVQIGGLAQWLAGRGAAQPIDALRRALRAMGATSSRHDVERHGAGRVSRHYWRVTDVARDWVSTGGVSTKSTGCPPGCPPAVSPETVREGVVPTKSTTVSGTAHPSQPTVDTVDTTASTVAIGSYAPKLPVDTPVDAGGHP